jgi:HK97 family phage major capsid protein
MARADYEAWIVDEHGTTPIQAFMQNSVVNALARHEPMASDTKKVPRMGSYTVGPVTKGTAYTETATVVDWVTLIASKIGGIERIAEEDLRETITAMRTISLRKVEASRAMAVYLDNAALGTTTVVDYDDVPFTSLYRQLTTNQAADDYTANANRIQTGGDVTYADFSSALGLVEDSVYVQDSNLAWLMHPKFKGYLRGLVDGASRPLWQSQAASGIAGGNVDSLLGYPIYWTRGAMTTTVATQAPTGGNALAFFGDVKHLIVGDPANPAGPDGGIGFQIQRAANGVGFQTDEALMKAAMRKAFTAGHTSAFSVIEKT